MTFVWVAFVLFLDFETSEKVPEELNKKQQKGASSKTSLKDRRDEPSRVGLKAAGLRGMHGLSLSNVKASLAQEDLLRDSFWAQEKDLILINLLFLKLKERSNCLQLAGTDFLQT